MKKKKFISKEISQYVNVLDVLFRIEGSFNGEMATIKVVLSSQVNQQTRSTAGLMEGWQCIVQVHDIVGTKPLDLPSVIQQLRKNKLGRLRKFYNEALLRKRDVKSGKVTRLSIPADPLQVSYFYSLIPFHAMVPTIMQTYRTFKKE